MSDRRTSVFENGLIWFGAGVSLAEILTGTLFAPLGFRKGLLAIVLGHRKQAQGAARLAWRGNTPTFRVHSHGEIFRWL